MKYLMFFFLVITICPFAFADGSITGTIKFEGQAPHPKFEHMDADPVCYTINKGNVRSPALVLGDNNTLGDVFVSIKGDVSGAWAKLVQNQTAIITQAGCNYSPHVSAVMVGQKVKFLNPDGTMHNVHAMCRVNPEFNGVMPDFRKELEVTFSKPETMFAIRCDVHPWMQAWMAVMAHPFFMVTASNGRYELKNVPNGTYVIEAWHEKLGTQTVTVNVTDHSTQKVDFTFSAPK